MIDNSMLDSSLVAMLNSNMFLKDENLMNTLRGSVAETIKKVNNELQDLDGKIITNSVNHQMLDNKLKNFVRDIKQVCDCYLDNCYYLFFYKIMLQYLQKYKKG